MSKRTKEVKYRKRIHEIIIVEILPWNNKVKILDTAIRKKTFEFRVNQFELDFICGDNFSTGIDKNEAMNILNKNKMLDYLNPVQLKLFQQLELNLTS